MSAGVLREATAEGTLAQTSAGRLIGCHPITVQEVGLPGYHEPMDEGLKTQQTHTHHTQGRTQDTAGRKTIIFTGQPNLRRVAKVVTSRLLEILL